MPSKKKKYNTRFPPARIKKIMQTDEEVGKVAAAVPVIISRALELFLESLVKTAGCITSSRNAKTLTTSHVKACVLSNEHFHFLKGLVDVYPDVQAEDETSGSSYSYEGQLPSNNSYHMNSSRGRRSRTNVSDAGPSHSTADESETWSAEEDGEGSTESCGETIPNHETSSVPSSSSSFPSAPCDTSNTSYQPGGNLSYVPGQMYCNATIDAFEDYDL